MICHMCHRTEVKTGLKVCDSCLAKSKVNRVNRKKRLLASGTCYICGQSPARPGLKTCSRCGESGRIQSAKKRKRLEDSGCCIVCGGSNDSDFILCSDCRSRRNKKKRALRTKRNRLGVCVLCGEPRSPKSSSYCEQHRRYAASSNRYAHDREFGGNRSIALERDNFECQVCHAGERLHVHHLDLNHSNNAPDNLITLCIFCHNAVTDVLNCPQPSQLIQFVKERYLGNLVRD